MCSPSNKRLIMKKFLAILLLLILFCDNVSGQRWISGQVTCVNGEPLIDAVVHIRHTHFGTVTDIDGNYRIEVDSLHTTLIFSFIGFDTQEITIGNDTIINVVLEEESFPLDEFQIWASRMRRRRHMLVSWETIETRQTIRNFRIQREVIRRETAGTQIGTPRIEYVKVSSRRRIQNFRIQREVISREIISSTGPTREEEREWEENERLRQLQALQIERIFPKYRSRGHICYILLPELNPILAKINFPQQAIEHGIEGRVMVRFRIETDGSITNVEILRGVDPSLNNAVLLAFQSTSVCENAFRSLPWTWREPLRPLLFTLPIRFILAERIDR